MKFCQIGNIDAWIDLYSSSMLHYLYYIYITIVLLDYFLKKWLFYEVGLSSSLLKNIWGLDFKEVEIELPPAQCMCWCYMPKKFCITQVWIEFFSSLSLSWLLQLFFSRNVSWKKIFGPTNLVQQILLKTFKKVCKVPKRLFWNIFYQYKIL